MQDTGTRASGKKTLTTGVEAAREGAPYERNFLLLRFNLVRKLSVKMNFFPEQGENTICPEDIIFGDDVHYW